MIRSESIATNRGQPPPPNEEWIVRAESSRIGYAADPISRFHEEGVPLTRMTSS